MFAEELWLRLFDSSLEVSQTLNRFREKGQWIDKPRLWTPPRLMVEAANHTQLGILSSCPVQSWADPQELAGTSGKSKADITTLPYLCQAAKPKEISVNLPVSERETFDCGVWTLVKGIPTTRAGWRKKQTPALFLSPLELTASGRRQIVYLFVHVTASWLHL